MDVLSIVIGVVVGLVAGIGVAYGLIKKSIENKSQQIIKDAEADAEVIKKEKIVQAKEKFLQLKLDHEKVITERNQKVLASENRNRQKEQTLNNKLKEVNNKERDLSTLRNNLTQQFDLVTKKQEELDKLKTKHIAELEKVSAISQEEAKQQLVENLKDEARTGAMSYIKDITEEAKINANKEAKKIVLQTIQRVAAEHAIENSVSVFNIESDDIKGRIIGREGRNIRAIEAATGVEIIVDDTPEAIILSCFDPVRREIARLSLHQ